LGKKAVFYLAVKEGIDHVAAPVYRALSELSELKDTEILVDGYPVKEYVDSETNTFWFVRTNRVVCHDYKTYLPIMLKYFTDFDAAGLVTWHEGDNAPDQVFSVHTTGDVDSANYGPANPQYMHNLLASMERNRLEDGLENYSITTEATHWSGVMYGDSSPDLIVEYPVPIMDIEIGSSLQSWSDEKAARVLAKALFEIFKDDGLKLKNILCAGGTHFDRAFSAEVLHTWDGQAYGISHIIPNQWLVTGGYDGEEGMTKLKACVESISGGIQGIAMHDGLKGAFKEKLRELGREYGVPVFKHQQLRKPDVIIWP
jgi:D-tyrosyl-tRNA(Tyr) deacylase